MSEKPRSIKLTPELREVLRHVGKSIKNLQTPLAKIGRSAAELAHLAEPYLRNMSDGCAHPDPLVRARWERRKLEIMDAPIAALIAHDYDPPPGRAGRPKGKGQFVESDKQFAREFIERTSGGEEEVTVRADILARMEAHPICRRESAYAQRSAESRK